MSYIYNLLKTNKMWELKLSKSPSFCGKKRFKVAGVCVTKCVTNLKFCVTNENPYNQVYICP